MLLNRYAYDRWGCDMFYVDSMEYDAVQPNPGFKHVLIMPSEIWRLVHAALPHILFIPVRARPRQRERERERERERITGSQSCDSSCAPRVHSLG